MLMEKLRNTSDDSRCVNAKIERGFVTFIQMRNTSEAQKTPEKCEVSGNLGMQFLKKKKLAK